MFFAFALIVRGVIVLLCVEIAYNIIIMIIIIIIIIILPRS